MVLAVAAEAWAWKPLFVGHRGCNIGVENTAEAYRNGVDVYGYDGLECDVRVTKDGFYVISHDETTNRLGGHLTVADATLAELRAEEYTQTRNGVTYKGHICTVDEYLAICVEKGVFPVIELKWTTGINNNDMSNFEGLAHLVIDQGLTDKVIFLTSMKKSQEYIATHFPQFTRQWLCNDGWRGNEEWCKEYGLNPSISIGNFDESTVRTFHEMGLHVAMWTVDSRENYLKYGNMGVHMMTCNSLRPSEMPELEDINWGEGGVDEPSYGAATVNATDWYTMNGMSVDRKNTTSGIYISVKHLSDGSIQTSKVLGQ
jgi:glycerophosphoryl diester phosphodiesterase